jgi:hypothetical protein
LVVGVGVVMAAILALSAGPAMANEWDEWNDWNGHHGVDDGFNDVLLLDEGSATFDELCSPGLPDGIWIPGCIFSDPLEADDIDFRFIDVDDDFFDDDIDLRFIRDDDFFDDDDDRDRDHKRRHHHHHHR